MGDKGRENKFDILPGTVDAKNPNSQSWNVYGGMRTVQELSDTIEPMMTALLGALKELSLSSLSSITVTAKVTNRIS